MKYILIVMLLLSIFGCSEKDSTEIDLIRFVSECKKVADKLKIEFLVESSNERLGCLIGQKDKVYGGLSGFNFSSLEQLRGAFKAIKIQERIPIHDKLQACSRKCKNIRGSDEKLACIMHCHKQVGYIWEW